MRDSIVFYRSFAEAIKCLPEENQLEAFWDIVNYALDGTEPDGTGAAVAVFKMAKPQIDTNYKRYENAVKGGEARRAKASQAEAKPKPKASQAEAKVKANVNVNVNENVNEKNKRDNTRFKPPTLDEVKAYCAERGNAVDAERFIDFYESKGWMVGKNKMRDWKSAVRNWERTDKGRQGQAAKPNKFNNFEQRQYDFNELERQLLRGG